MAIVGAHNNDNNRSSTTGGGGRQRNGATGQPVAVFGLCGRGTQGKRLDWEAAMNGMEKGQKDGNGDVNSEFYNGDCC